MSPAVLLLAGIGLVISMSAQGAQSWHLDEALNAPDWLTVGGEARLRYESLDGQYRILRSGSDQVWVSRLLLHARADTEVGRFAVEFQDARAFGADGGTPLSAGMVDTLDVLQLSYTADFAGADDARVAALKIGRFTMDIGSRRFVQRNNYRNAIGTFTGAHWHSRRAGGSMLDAFFTVPVERRPLDPAALLDNDFEADRESWGRRFWGVHLQFPGLVADTQLDLLIYGLHESDRGDLPTPNRKVMAPGFRFRRAPRTGGWDFDIESAYRFGSRQPNLLDNESDALDVEALMFHGEVGYTFNSEWNLRLGIEYDLASGDEDPDDGSYERYEPLFGSRRRDLGNTGIYGPLTRSNASVLGLRVSFARGRWDGRAHIQQAGLDSATDFWVVAGLRDPDGNSGRDLGVTFDGRLRYWLRPGSLRLEALASLLEFGEFPREVPLGPESRRALYGALQITAYF